MRALLEHGADPNTRDIKRRTPLHVVLSWDAESSNWLGFARILLAHGPDVGTEDEEGRTPMQIALVSGQDKMVQLLSEYCSK